MTNIRTKTTDFLFGKLEDKLDYLAQMKMVYYWIKHNYIDQTQFLELIDLINKTYGGNK